MLTRKKLIRIVNENDLLSYVTFYESSRFVNEVLHFINKLKMSVTNCEESRSIIANEIERVVADINEDIISNFNVFSDLFEPYVYTCEADFIESCGVYLFLVVTVGNSVTIYRKKTPEETKEEVIR